MDVRFETWKIRSRCRSGSLKTVAKELVKHKLGIQDVRWDRSATEPANDYTFLYGKRNTDFFVHIRSGVKMVEFNYRMSCIILGGY